MGTGEEREEGGLDGLGMNVPSERKMGVRF